MGFLTSLRGVGYFVLQALRVATVITLAAAAAACWVLMIKVDKSRSFFIFECISLFFTSVIAIALIVSEFPVISAVKNYFRRAWPVLSEVYGVGWLGAAMIILGCNILGSLNEPAYDADNLGTHFSGLVLSSGVLCVTFGALNVFSSLIWRDGKEGITSRDIRANGSLANKRNSLPSYNASPASSIRNEKGRSKFGSMFWKNEQNNNNAAAGKNVTRPIISGPVYAHQNPERNENQPAPVPTSDRLSPIVPGLKRPDTALHPMHTGRSSRYSLASMTRF